MVNNNKKSTALGRAMQMGKLSAGIAGSYIGYQLQSLYLDEQTSKTKLKGMHKRNAQRIRKELQTLRGPAMKLGQALSMQDHALPQEVIQELSHLQMKAPAMHPTLMRIQFRKALGKNPEEVFEDFDAEPFAAASLGQVHRATTPKGETVAVKIQYPAIREVIENDFKLLNTLVTPAKAVGYFSTEAINEIERGILEETDYNNEASNLDLFRRGFKRHSYVTVPKVFNKYSTSNVLTMSFIEGLHLKEFLATKPTQAIRNRIGTQLIELFCHQLHCIRALHADPHPGNYMFSDNAHISLLDFGCVKHLGPNTVALVRLFADRAWEKGKFEEMSRRTWGTTPAADTDQARNVMKEVIHWFDLLYPSDPNTVIDFGDPKTIKHLTRVWNSAFRSKLLNPEFIFTSRAEMGIYNLLHTLKAKVATSRTLNQVLSIARAKQNLVPHLDPTLD